MRRLILMPMFLCLSLAACGEPPAGEGTLLLGWSFVDGRRCAESGAERVVLTRAGEYEVLKQADCPLGLDRPALEASFPAGSYQLQLTALSGSETPLYRGTLVVDLAPGIRIDRVVDLAFIGGL